MAAWGSALLQLEGAYSDETLRSYRSGFEVSRCGADATACQRCLRHQKP